MRRYFREIPIYEERKAAAAQLVEWGYPREISADEIGGGQWISYERGTGVAVGYLWFVAGPDDESVAVHAGANPEETGRLGNQRNMIAIEIIAELLGAKRVYSMLSEGGEEFGIPARLMRRYLRIRGWTEDACGAYRELGG